MNLLSYHLNSHMLKYCFLKIPDYCCFKTNFLFVFISSIDKTCQWYFKHDCAKTKKAVCKLWKRKGALHQVFWAVVRVWPDRICGTSHLSDVSLSTWAHKFILETYVAEGLHHSITRYSTWSIQRDVLVFIWKCIFCQKFKLFWLTLLFWMFLLVLTFMLHWTFFLWACDNSSIVFQLTYWHIHSFIYIHNKYIET